MLTTMAQKTGRFPRERGISQEFKEDGSFSRIAGKFLLQGTFSPISTLGNLQYFLGELSTLYPLSAIIVAEFWPKPKMTKLALKIACQFFA
jgi:hypothetical protein